jgi:hypothetical protein
MSSVFPPSGLNPYLKTLCTLEDEIKTGFNLSQIQATCKELEKAGNKMM